MAFLTNAQLRHGAWGSVHADSANSNRGVFAGAREGKIAWRERLPIQRGFSDSHPVADSAGNLYWASELGGLQARTPLGAPILIPQVGTAGLKEVHSLHVGPGSTLVTVGKNALSCVGLDGSLRWRIEGFQPGAAMLAPDGQSLFMNQAIRGGAGSSLISLGLGTGIEHWRLPFPGQLHGPALTANGTLILLAHYDASPPHRLLALDGKAGETLWQQKVTPNQWFGPPSLFGDDLIFVQGSGMLQAFQRDGRPAWSHKFPMRPELTVGAAGQVALVKSGPEEALWVVWPDGQVHQQVTIPAGQSLVHGPYFDATGHLFLLTIGKMTDELVLLKYSADLDLLWETPLMAPGPWEIATSLLVLPEAVLISIKLETDPGQLKAGQMYEYGHELICVR